MGFKLVQFKNVVEFPPKILIEKGDTVPFIEMGDVNPQSRYVYNNIKKEFKSGGAKFANKDILFARITPCLENGKIAQVKLNDMKLGFGSTEFFVFRARPTKMNQSFLYYISKSDLLWKSAVNSMVGASGRQRADAKFLNNLKFFLPPLSIQQKIAAILSAYDDLIENNNRRIFILEKMAEEIYKEWFVRMRFPGYEKKKFVKGVPENWKIKKVRDFGKIVTGKTPSTKEAKYYNGHFLFIKTPDMHQNLFVYETGETLTKEGIDSNPSQIIPPYSICVSCIGTGGVVAITTSLCQTNQQINTVVPYTREALCWLFFTLKNLKETIKLFGYTGATMTNLSKGKFERIKIIKPEMSVIKEFNYYCFPLFQKVKELMKKNLNLKQTRDHLLTRLISGKLNVENLDIEFPKSMREESDA